MLLRCYRDGSDPKHSGGWLTTGDVGEIDPGGRLVVHGRRGDLIITGGENVWPEPVEKVLSAVPGVADVAVAGRDDEEWGQRVVAFVVASADGPPTLDELTLRGEGRLRRARGAARARARRPIPRTALGKVRRGALDDSVRRSALPEAL